MSTTTSPNSKNYTGVLLAAIIKFERSEPGTSTARETETACACATISLSNSSSRVRILFEDERLINKYDIKYMAEQFNQRRRGRLSIVWITILGPYPNILMRSLLTTLSENRQKAISQIASKYPGYDPNKPESDDEVLILKHSMFELASNSLNEGSMESLRNNKDAISRHGAFYFTKDSPAIIVCYITEEHDELAYRIDKPVRPGSLQMMT